MSQGEKRDAGNVVAVCVVGKCFNKTHRDFSTKKRLYWIWNYGFEKERRFARWSIVFTNILLFLILWRDLVEVIFSSIWNHFFSCRKKINGCSWNSSDWKKLYRSAGNVAWGEINNNCPPSANVFFFSYAFICTIQVFAEPLKNSCVIPEKDIKTMFPKQLLAMKHGHERFMNELDERLNNWKWQGVLGDIFAKLGNSYHVSGRCSLVVIPYSWLFVVFVGRKQVSLIFFSFLRSTSWLFTPSTLIIFRNLLRWSTSTQEIHINSKDFLR